MTITGVAWHFEAIGTRWSVETEQPLAPAIRDRVSSIIDAFDREWSRFRADSIVTQLSDEAGAVAAPRDARAMLDAYSALDDATEGGVNPLIGDALARRGYDVALSLVDRGPSPAPAAWREIVSWSEQTLAVSSPVTIDVGALGKGRLVDLVAAELSDVDGWLVVDASGDLISRGRAERIALEHPYDQRRAIGVWEVTDAALCASAINRRAWGDGLHHVLDARTGEPVQTVAATWAVGVDAMHADGAATALFFDGGPRLAHEWGIEWVRMYTDGRVQWSPGCDAQLFTAAAPHVQR